jgi:hypothetical protein
VLGGAVVGGLGTPSSHPMMLFLPSLVVITRATLEPDATIDPSLHHLSQATFSSLPAIFITKIKVIYILESERASTTKRKIAEILLKMSVFLARLSRWIWFYAVANTVRTTIRLRGISVDSFSLRSLSLFLAGSFSRVVNPKQT